MTDQEMMLEAIEINRLVRGLWPRGFSSIICNSDQGFAVVIHDDNLHCEQFKGPSVVTALAEARAYLAERKPMTRDRLAAILGYTEAA